jgi:2-enoate reductase
MPPGCFLSVSELVRKPLQRKGIKTNTGQDVIVAAVGKLGYPDIAEKALQKGFAI